MNIKAILWDFSGVLLIPTDGRGNDYYAKSLGITAEILDAYQQSDLNRRVNLGEITSTEFYRTILSEQGIELNRLSQREKIFFEAFQANTPLIQFIRTIPKTIKLSLLSNYSNSLRPILENTLKIADLFDEIIISSEVKLLKPEKEIFQLAFNRLGARPQETIFIDDTAENTTAAAELGIHAIPYCDNAQIISAINEIIS